MSITCLLAWACALLMLPALLILWATESRTRRAQRLRSYGWSQKRIADHLGCSRTTVRRLLTA